MDSNPHKKPEHETGALVEQLARAIYTFARHRPGHLAAVSVRIPKAAADISDALSTRLQAFGINGAVVHVQRRTGDAALVSLEYER